MSSNQTNLWDLFVKGDQQSFKELYENNYELLINYGYRFSRDLPLLEDAVQNLFIKLWQKRGTISTPVSVTHYLLKAFRNTLINSLQSESNLQNKINSFESLSFELTASKEELLIEEEEMFIQKKILEEKLSLLTNRQREGIYLRFFRELGYEEIAEVLKMEVGGVYKLIYRALDRLKINHKEETPI